MVMVINGWVIGFFRRDLFVFSTSTTDGNVSKCTAFRPIASTCFAEVPGLREAIVVVVTELGVGRIAPRALEGLVMRGPKPPLY